MRVLIACERSGVVREAFASRGHDAWSCDLLPTEQPGQHIQGDVLAHLFGGWDLLIAHPPCQYLSRAGTPWLHRQPGRREKREQAMQFFMSLWNAPIDLVCLENPVGYAWQAFRPPDQVIDPWMFGDAHRKRTCLWLRGLPALVTEPDLFTPCSTHRLRPPEPLYVDSSGRPRYFTDSLPSSSPRRSIMFRGIAAAMAEQWSVVDCGASCKGDRCIRQTVRRRPARAETRSSGP